MFIGVDIIIHDNNPLDKKLIVSDDKKLIILDFWNLLRLHHTFRMPCVIDATYLIFSAQGCDLRDLKLRGDSHYRV
jgi:hypothetical protein